MAAEISLSAFLSVTKNGATFDARGDATLDQTGHYAVNQVQNVSHVAEENVDLGDITGNPAVLFLKNLEAAGGNSLYFKAGSTIIGTLAPGQFALYPVGAGGSTPKVQGVGGTVKCLVLAIEA